MITAVLFTDDPGNRCALGSYWVLEDAVLLSLGGRMFVRTGEQIVLDEGVLGWEFMHARPIVLDHAPTAWEAG